MDYKDLKTGDIIRIQMCNNEIVTGILQCVNKKFKTLDLYCCTPENSLSYVIFSQGGQYCPRIEDIQDIILALEDEKCTLYNAIGKYFTEKYDKDWYNHFTDSSYFDVQDYLFDVFCINVDLIYPDFINEIHTYIWDKLCEAMGCKAYDGDEFVEQLVNKQEFIAKLKKWLELETNWNMEYDEEGRNPNYGKIDELIKYMEE